MAQNDQIQALIQEIDEVLNKTSPRLPWVMSTDAMRQRQVLEQARSCLDKLQIPSQGLTDQAIDPEAKLLPSGQPAAESAQQVLQAVLQEMTYLRVNMLQPMRSDVDLLRQQREALTQEIRQLEAQRQQYVLPQSNPQLLMEFLQSAMGQMQESLRGQVTQMIASLAVEDVATAKPPLLQGVGDENLAIASLSPVQRLEQIQRIQTQSDQLLLKLDSTLQVIFDSLQNNILSYQESLEQGLSRMQSLGQQGEAMFSTLVTRLAEQLGKEASVYLQSPVHAPSQSLAHSSQPPIHAPSQPHILEGDRALSPQGSGDESADAEIARLLEELNSLTPTSSTNSLPNPLDMPWQPQPFAPEVGSLEALDDELQQLDLSVIPPDSDNFPDDDDDLTFFQEDQGFPFANFSSEDATRIQNLDLDQAIQELDQVGADPSQSFPSPSPGEAVYDSGSEDLESALDLLNQLSAEAEAELSEIGTYTAESYGVESYPLPTSPFKPDNILETRLASEGRASEGRAEAIAPPVAPLIDSPDNLYTDDFYQSLFGDAKDEHLKNLEPSSEVAGSEVVGSEVIGNEVAGDLDSNLENLHPINLHPINLQTSDLLSETPEPNDLLSFELDAENELAPTLDLNEWFDEDGVPRVDTPQPDAPLKSHHSTTETPPDLALTESSLHEDIFGGIVDPAIARPIQDAEADFLSDFSIAPFPQSVENFLLSEPVSSPESNALNPSESNTSPIEEDIFWELAEEMQTEPVASPPIAPPIDTISALTDLISAYAAPDAERSNAERFNAERSDAGFKTEMPGAETSEIEIPETEHSWAIAAPAESDEIGAHNSNAFEPAHPGEDLLIPATTPELTIASFEVGEETLQRLTADLSTLELSSAEIDLGSDSTPLNHEDHSSVDPLADLYLEMPPETAIASQADQIANAITLEDLLFTDGLTNGITDELDSSSANAHLDTKTDAKTDAKTDTKTDANLFEAANQTSVQSSDQTLEQLPDQTSNDQSVSSKASSASGNAFTLEGLDILFEGVLPASPNVKAPEIPDSEMQPKKKG